MKLAIMQPYLFPYMGYFQLIAAADRFVLYDDVSYIKQGWINRNRVLVNKEPHVFTLPLVGAGSFVSINSIMLHAQGFITWRDKFLRTVGQAYSKAPHAQGVLLLLENVLADPHPRLVDLLAATIRSVTDYLGIRTEIVPTSSFYGNGHLSGQDRILDICIKERAVQYINAIGGKDLYATAAFDAHGVQLRFLRSRVPAYEQFGGTFQSGLSILDAMMFVPQEQLQLMMGEYDLE